MLWYAGAIPLELYDKRIRGDEAKEFDFLGLTCYPCAAQALNMHSYSVSLYKILDGSEHALKMDYSDYSSVLSQAMNDFDDILYGEDAGVELPMINRPAIFAALRQELISQGFHRIDVMSWGSHAFSNYLYFPDCLYLPVDNRMP